jgi:hypothetical protein
MLVLLGLLSGQPAAAGEAVIFADGFEDNVPPTANDDSATTDEDAPVTLFVLANDTDPDVGHGLTIINVSGNTGSVINNGTDLSYNPTAAFNSLAQGGAAIDTFTYTIQDPVGAQSTATVTVTVDGLNDAPTPDDESYSAVGNTQLAVGKTGPFAAATYVSSLAGVLAGDTDPDTGDSVSVVAFSGDPAGAPAGDFLNLAADGSFFYTPAPGHTAPTMFNYTVQDTFGGMANGSVTINIAKMVWYVNNTANGGAANTGAGTSTSPFSTLSDGADNAAPDDAEDASTAGHILYIFQGSGTANLDQGIALKDQQKLWGEGVSLIVDIDDGGPEAPQTLFTGNPANKPHVTRAGAGDAVNVLASTANGHRVDIEIRGLQLSSAAGNAVDVSSADAASLGVTIADNNVSGAALEGVDVNAGSTSTQTLAIHDNAFNATGTALDVTRTAGTAIITAFHDNTVSGDAGGGLIVTGPVTFDASTATGGIQPVPGGTTVIGQSGNGVGGAGLVLSNVTGALNFANLAAGTIGAGNLAVFSDGMALSATGTGGFDLDVTDGAGQFVASGGAAVSLSTLDANIQNALVVSTTSSSGVALSTVSGAFSATNASSITKSSGGGTAFAVSSSSANVTYGGTLNVASGSGVGLSNNTGAVNFSGQLTLNTGANPAFSATGSSGTVTATHADSTLTTTTATALTVNGPDLGAGGLVFRSISANGAANGIVLQDTGATAGLAVNGTGTTDGSGGTIQNITGRGASFINARNITLKNMNLTNTATSAGAPCGSAAVVGANTGCNAAIHLNGVTNVTLDNLNVTTSGQQGINGIDVTGFNLSSSVLSGLGNGPDEDGLHFHNLLGTSSITGTSISGSGDDNVNIQNRSSTAASISFTSGSFNTGVLGSGLLFGVRDSANTTIAISGVTSDNNFSGGIVADAFDSSTMEITVSGSTITNNNDGIQVSSSQTSTARFDIDNNDFIGNDFLAVTLLKAAFSTGGVLEGAVRNNSPITVGNGRPADAISVFQAGGGALRAAITNNTFSYAGTQRVILVQAGQDGNGSIDTTITGNAIDIQLDGAGNAVAGILAQSAITGPGVTSALCFDMGGAGALSNTFTHSLGGAIAAGDIRVRQRNSGTVRLPAYGGSATDTVAVVNYLSGRNTLVSAPTATFESTGFAGGGACTQPTLP